MADERLQLTVALERTGETLRVGYYDGKNRPLVAHAGVPWASIGREFVYQQGGVTLSGLDGINAALDQGDVDDLVRYFTRDRLVEVGHILFSTLMGNSERWEPVLRELFDEHTGPRPNPPRRAVRVRVVTSVKELVDLPWRLCAWKGKYLADSGWTFEVANFFGPSRDVAFDTPCPMLVVAPRYSGAYQDVGTEEHLQALRQALPEPYLTPAYFRVVRTRAEVRDAFLGMRPQVLYYYGHAEIHSRQVCLLFNDEQGEIDRVLGDDLRRLMAGYYPDMAVVNACKSGAGGWFSVGYQLAPDVPVTVANATTSWSQYSGAAAIALLRRCLVLGNDPVIAAHALDESASTRGFEWAMRTIHADYRSWRAQPYATMGQISPIGLRLDRDGSRERALSRVAHLVRSDEHRLMALIVYANEGNRVDLAHEQIKDHLEDHAYHLAQISWQRVRFPLEKEVQVEDFERELAASLGAMPGEPIAYALRRNARGLEVASSATPIVWLDWGVFGHPYDRIIGRRTFMSWVEYCSELAHDTPPDIRVIAYMGFETKPSAHDKLEELVRELSLRYLASHAFSVELVPPLPNLSVIDIARFLQDRNNSRCPPELVMDMARLLFKDTAGHYAKTLAHIENAERDGWYNLFRKLSPNAELTGPTDSLF